MTAVPDWPAEPARELAFAPVGAEGRVVEAVVRRLGEAITFGLLRVGERLPPESDLAARLDVAPGTLREALSIMRRAGIVETRRGRGGGTVVRGYGPTAGRAELLARLRGFSADDLRDLIAFGRAVDGFAAAEAARRAGPAEVERLRALAAQADAAAEPLGRRRADAQLHIEVAAASQSARLTQAAMRIQAELHDLLLLVADEPRIIRLARAQHDAIVEAIAARDASAARAAAEAHLESAADLVSGLVLPALEELPGAPG